MFEQVAENVPQDAVCGARIEGLLHESTRIVNTDLTAGMGYVRWKHRQAAAGALTRSSLGHSVMHTRSTPRRVASMNGASRAESVEMVSTTTMGFKLSIRAFAASTLYGRAI